MRPYEASELAELINGNAKKLNVEISEDGMETIAKASRGPVSQIVCWNGCVTTEC